MAKTMNTQQFVSYVVTEFVNREQQQGEHREKHVKLRPDSDLSFFGHAGSVSSLPIKRADGPQVPAHPIGNMEASTHGRFVLTPSSSTIAKIRITAPSLLRLSWSPELTAAVLLCSYRLSLPIVVRLLFLISAIVCLSEKDRARRNSESS